MTPQDAAQALVLAKIANNELFTVHDITLEVRGQGHYVKHQEIKDCVHTMWDTGAMGIEYKRELLHNVAGLPYLYLPVVADVADYTDPFATKRNTATNSAAVINIPTSSDNFDDNSDGEEENEVNIQQIDDVVSKLKQVTKIRCQKGGCTRIPQLRGDITLPNSLICLLNVRKVFAIQLDEEVIICSDPSEYKDSNNISSYTVDRSGQVRVTGAFLAKANLKNKIVFLELIGANLPTNEKKIRIFASRNLNEIASFPAEFAEELSKNFGITTPQAFYDHAISEQDATANALGISGEKVVELVEEIKKYLPGDYNKSKTIHARGVVVSQ